jgi:cell division protein FtsB
MKDLIDFNRFQIEALQAEICKLKQENNQLATYCFEALEDGITNEYKTLIKQEIYKLKTN